MKNLLNILTVVLSSTLLVVFYTLSCNSTLPYGNWHYNDSGAKFIKDLMNTSPDSINYLNRRDISLPSYLSVSVEYISNDDLYELQDRKDTTILLVDSQDVHVGYIEEISIVKDKTIQDFKPVVKKINTTNISNTIIKKNETIEKTDIVKDTSVIIEEIEEVIDNNIINEENNLLQDNISIEKKEDKKVIKKPRFKDFRTSIEYQKALKEYYKAIEE